MPINAELMKGLKQGIKDHPEFFYDLFVDPSFSNADADNESKSTSYIRTFFKKNTGWLNGPLQLFMQNDVSRLSGPQTVSRRSDDDLELPADQIPPLRQSPEVNAFYDLRNIFKEMLDEKTHGLKNLTAKETDELNSRLERVLSLEINNNFITVFMYPILMDLLSPKGSRIIDRYLAKKQLLPDPDAAYTTKAPLPGNLQPLIGNNLVTLVNGIYTGNLRGLKLPDTAYPPAQLFSRTVSLLEQALGLNIYLRPENKDFIVNHVYRAIFQGIAAKVALTDEDTISHEQVIDEFDEISIPMSDERMTTLENILDNIHESIDKTDYETSFAVGKSRFRVAAPNSYGDREYYKISDEGETLLDIEEFNMVVLEHLSEILTKKPEHNIIAEIANILQELPTILAIAHYGSYATTLTNAISNAATSDLSVFDSYAAIEAAKPKKPDNYAVLSEAKMKVYNILDRQVIAATEQAIAYRFAKFAVEGTDVVVSPKIVNMFKGEKSHHRRVQYLVLEMLRNNTTPHSRSKSNILELNQAIKLYRALKVEAGNIQAAPLDEQITEINQRIVKGEITDQDLKVLMRTTLPEPVTMAITHSLDQERNNLRNFLAPIVEQAKRLKQLKQPKTTKKDKPPRPN